MTEPHNNGGPAFPNPGLADPTCSFQVDVTGMSLRDWFAGQAMQAIIAKLPLFDRDAEFGNAPENMRQLRADVAESAFFYADAMIEARK